jgi:hypothetical protein
MNENEASLPMKLEEKKSRGGQKRSFLAIARAKLWCLEVKGRTNLPYKALDEMFLGKNPAEVFFEPPKAFEKIMRSGTYLRGASHRRGLEELVEAVERHPDFQGTAIVFNSKLWELFELKTISEKEIFSRIDDVFREHGVERYPLPKIESWRYGRNPDIDVQHPVNPIEMLRLQAADLNQITRVYLMILYYFFAKTTISARFERVMKIHTDSLRDYFDEKLGDFGQECFLEALKRVQSVQVVRVFEPS